MSNNQKLIESFHLSESELKDLLGDSYSPNTIRISDEDWIKVELHIDKLVDEAEVFFNLVFADIEKHQR